MAERFQEMAGEDGSGLDDPQVQRELADMDMQFSRDIDPRPDMEFTPELSAAADEVLGQLGGELSGIQRRMEEQVFEPQGDSLSRREQARNIEGTVRELDSEANRLSSVYERIARAVDNNDAEGFVNATFDALNNEDIPVTPENFEMLQQALRPYGEQFSDMWRRRQREQGAPAEGVDMESAFDDDSDFAARSEFDDADTEGLDRSFESQLSEVDTGTRDRTTYVGQERSEGEITPWQRRGVSQTVESRRAEREGRDARTFDDPSGAERFLQRKREQYQRIEDPENMAVTPEGVFERVPYSEVVRAEFLDRQRSDELDTGAQVDPGDQQTLTDLEGENAPGFQQRFRRGTDEVSRRSALDRESQEAPAQTMDEYLARRGRELYEADTATSDPPNRAELFDPENPAAYLDNFEAVRKTDMPPQLGGGDPTILSEEDVRAAETERTGDRELPRGGIPFTQIEPDGTRRERVFNAMDLAKRLQDRPTADVGRGSDGGTVQRAADLVWESISSLLNRPLPSHWRQGEGRLELRPEDIPGDTVVYTLGSGDARTEITWDEVLAEGAERFRRRVDMLRDQQQLLEQRVRETATDGEANTRAQNRLDAVRDQLETARQDLNRARSTERKRDNRLDTLANGITADASWMTPGDIIEVKKKLLGEDAFTEGEDGPEVTAEITPELQAAAEQHRDARIQQRVEATTREFNRRDPEQREPDDSAEGIEADQPVDVGDPRAIRKLGLGDSPAGTDQDTRPQRRRAPGDRDYTPAGRLVTLLGTAERAVQSIEQTSNVQNAKRLYRRAFDHSLSDQVQDLGEIRTIARRQRDRIANQLWAIDEQDRIADMESALQTHTVENARNRYRQLFGESLPARTTLDEIRERLRAREQPEQAAEDTGPAPQDMQGLVDAWARKIGLQTTIEVVDYETARQYMTDEQLALAEGNRFAGFRMGTQDGRTLIHVSPRLSGQMRVETLAHEMGHVIFREHTEALTDEQASEVLRAFNRWRAKNNKDAVTVDEVWNSKKALVSITEEWTKNGRTLGQLSQKNRDYVLDYEEWFADNVARWLTQTKEPRTVVERFFKSVADSLKRLLDAAGNRYRADRSVAGFMRNLWGAKQPDQAYVTADAVAARDQAYEDMPRGPAIVQIHEQIVEETGVEPEGAADVADAAVHHESDPHSAGATASFRRVYDQILTTEERRALAQVFTQPQVRRKLDAFLDYGTMALIDGGDTKAAVIYGYHHWLNGDLTKDDLSPRAHSLFQKFGRTLSDTFGIVTRHEQGMEVIQALENGAIAGRQQAESHVGAGVVRRYLERNALEKVGARAMNAYEQTMKAFRFVMPAQSALYMSDIPALQAFTNEFNPRVGEQRVGQTMFEARQQMRSRFHNAFNNATRDLSEEQGREALEILQGNPDAALPAEDTPVRQAVDEVRRTLREMRSYAVARGVNMGYIEDYFPWVFDTDTLSNRRAEFVNLMAQEKYAEDVAALFGEDVATTQEGREGLANRVYDVLMNHDGYGDTDMQVQDGNNTPALSAAHQRRLKFLYDKGDDGDRRQLASFFSKDIGGTLAPYVEQIVKRAEWTSRFGTQGEGINTRLDQARAEGATDRDIEMAKKYLNAMMGTHGRELAPPLRYLITQTGELLGKDWSGVEPDKVRSVQGAIMVYQNFRVLGLATLTSIADTGGIVARSGDLNTAFAAFRAGMKEIALGIRSMVREQGESEDTYRSELRKLAESMGTIDMHMVNEVLGESYGGLYLHGRARQWNEKWFRWIQLQRWTRFSRMMALASAKTFLVRHRGGLYNEHSQRFMEQLNLRDDDIITDDAGDLAVYSDGDRSQMIAERRGHMERAAAEREAGNHPAADEALAEANRIRDDLNRDMRIRTALNRFVDESVMRPNAAHRPIWASHPDAMLIFHLKQFAYSIHNQIVRRILSEAGQGNYRPAAFALSYIPIMMASDLLREMVQFGPDGDPRKEHWDSWDRVKDAVHRSGMTGMGTFLLDAHKDRTQFGGIGLESMQGPTMAQSLDIADTFFGDRKASDTLADALPGQALYGNWGFDATQAEERPVGELANMGSGRYYFER